MTTHNHLRPVVVCALLAAAVHPAAALDVTLDADAFNLAAALAPAPSLLNSVDGVFTESGTPPAGQGALGTFVNAAPSLGFDAGIVLGTGNVLELFAGAPTSSGVDFGWTPAVDTAALLAQVPGFGSTFGDAVRLSLQITPSFDANFVNFNFSYGTNEFGLETDRVGIFVDGVYYGLLDGSPIDQAHPWMGLAASGFGLDSVLYPEGDSLAAPFVTLSIPILSPGSALMLDLVVADVLDGSIDTAAFFGGLVGSETALGYVLIPEPGTYAAALGALALLALAVRRRFAR